MSTRKKLTRTERELLGNWKKRGCQGEFGKKLEEFFGIAIEF